jgi:hypothetical protein
LIYSGESDVGFLDVNEQRIAPPFSHRERNGFAVYIEYPSKLLVFVPTLQNLI